MKNKKKVAVTQKIRNLRRKIGGLRYRLTQPDCNSCVPGNLYSAADLYAHIEGEIAKFETQLASLEVERVKMK